ncbi:hypothetical protein [Rubinisphaera italica]|uniref:Uncharacterized protein n=1 Tax=Rubinisphaera italica TaxID=2527969 RepID=A0A5C5XM99_9PLAN|nr:hypothetical protein [Rubinisphaera italica]TWT64287.1 hypothetical protein Pan54_50490 [Rubinisphaera italica]
MNGSINQDNSRNTSRSPAGWSHGFRLGLIGFLIAWSFSAHGQDLQPVQQVPDPNEEGLEVPVTPDQVEKPGKIVPGDAVPSLPMLEEVPKPVEVSPMPLRVPDTKSTPVPEVTKPVSPEPMKPVQKPEPELAPSKPALENTNKFAEKPLKSSEKESGEQWTMLITSGPSRAAGTPAQKDLVTFDLDKKTHQVVGGPHVKQLGPEDEHLLTKASEVPHHKSKVVAADYEAIYQSIPYSRAEYLANPAYRHEATMEILFGELRPTVIHKEDKPQRVYNQPRINDVPEVYRPQLPWNWNGPGRAYGFGYGYGPAGYFGARYPYWTPNSTYRIYQTQYGPLFNRYYRPLGY